MTMGPFFFVMKGLRRIPIDENFPEWLKPHLKVISKFGDVDTSLQTFFEFHRDRKEMTGKPDIRLQPVVNTEDTGHVALVAKLAKVSTPEEDKEQGQVRIRRKEGVVTLDGTKHSYVVGTVMDKFNNASSALLTKSSSMTVTRDLPLRLKRTVSVQESTRKIGVGLLSLQESTRENLMPAIEESGTLDDEKNETVEKRGIISRSDGVSSKSKSSTHLKPKRLVDPKDYRTRIKSVISPKSYALFRDALKEYTSGTKNSTVLIGKVSRFCWLQERNGKGIRRMGGWRFAMNLRGLWLGLGISWEDIRGGVGGCFEGGGGKVQVSF
ncbi:hypothetical protein BC829DRAFT_69269 [Chytridium lagenaria]|nr:hypothetical protein BC829DRAFT_69269 [Chytridium lagenaria]